MAHLKLHVGPGERQARQDATIVQLEREIKNVEKQMLERAAILHQLGAIQAAEAQEHSNHLISKYRRRSLTVENELERVYGKDTAREYTESPDLQPRAVEDVIAYRTKEHELKQQERALQIKYLSKERERLQDAREKLKLKRQALERLPSPADSRLSGSLPPSLIPSPVPSLRSVHSAKSEVHRTMADLPDAVERIFQLRQAVQRDYDYKKRPYQGELGLESYEPWQLDDFVIVRKLVEDFVDKFIIRHIHPGYSHFEPKMQRVMKKADQEEYAKNVGVLSERRAVQLVGEEMNLEVTRLMMREVVEEVFYIHRFTHNATANMCMTEAERVSTGEAEGRDPEDPAYNLITKGLFTLQQKRNDKSEIWGHSQGLQLFLSDMDVGEPQAAEADE